MHRHLSEDEDWSGGPDTYLRDGLLKRLEKVTDTSG